MALDLVARKVTEHIKITVHIPCILFQYKYNISRNKRVSVLFEYIRKGYLLTVHSEKGVSVQTVEHTIG